ncbi:MAG: aminopeptidase [Bacillota bacterium]
MQKYYNKLARLTARVGVNVQPNQPVVINCPVEQFEFARILASECYNAGASEVFVRHRDEVLTRQNFENCTLETLGAPHAFHAEINNKYSEMGACFISIYSEDPDNLAGISAEKLQVSQVANSLLSKPFRNRTMSNEVRWVVISIPTNGWAKKVFPDLEIEAAKEKLGEMIAKAMYLDCENPTEMWQIHNKKQEVVSGFLNRERFESFHFENSLGTNLTVGMMPQSTFSGASEIAKDGVSFVANMPTEEIFSAPHREKTNGIVFSSKPLSYQGVLIDNFWVEFENGKAVKFGGEKGEKALENIIKTDENSAFLGEIAFVEADSAISNMNQIFYNTLFDENASCHLAFGKGYNSCVDNGDDDAEKLFFQGLNDSLAHVDFMIGSPDLKVMGKKADGSEVVIMENGNFVKDLK